MRARLWGGVAALTLLSACPSTSVYRTADPLAPGAWEVGGALGAGVIADREQETTAPTGHMEFAVRRGIRENLDLGVKLVVAGTEVNATWRVYKREWSIALAPSLSGLYARESPLIPESLHFFAQLGVIASRPLSERWAIALGPSTGGGLYVPQTGGSARGLWLGAFVHLRAKVGDLWHLGPELTTYQVVAGEVPVRGGAFQLGLGLSRSL